MKTKIILSLVIVLFLAGMNNIIAQSDYQVVQNFKKEVSGIEQSIRNADSLEVLDQVSNNINKLSSDYASHKTLLDNSLYPDNFDKTIQRLRGAVDLRRGDFSQISDLKTTVTGLREVVDTLQARNDDLSRQFAELESSTNKRIAQLEGMISQLRASLQKRDQIVMNMINDLLPENVESPSDLSSQEKQEIVSKAEKTDVLSNIKRAVSDNIRFLDATRLNPEDIRKVKAQKDNFVKIWKSAGPTMVELYAEKGKRTDQFNEIDQSFAAWDAKIQEEIWSSINTEFSENNIHLRRFSNGEEFASAVTSYIDDQIMNSDAKDSKQAEAEYNRFADSIWNDKIENHWLPLLQDNKLISDNQEDSIQVRLASWKDTVYPQRFNWLYVVIGVLVIAVIVLLFTRKKSLPPPDGTTLKSQNRA